MEEAPVFRAPKRRKVHTKGTDLSPKAAIDVDVGVDVKNGNAVVVKRQLGTKKTGTRFSSNSTVVHEAVNDQELEMVQASTESERPFSGLQSRFVGAGNSTRVTNTDRYMYVIKLVPLRLPLSVHDQVLVSCQRGPRKLLTS